MPTAPLPGPADAWTATQIRLETMSWIFYGDGTYTQPQYITDGVPRSQWEDAAMSLCKEGYTRKDGQDIPSGGYGNSFTFKGAKYRSRLMSRGHLADRGTP